MTGTPLLTKFSPPTKDEIYKEIIEMKNKSCELDTVCTSVLKHLLTIYIGTILQTVNLSFTSGSFCVQWKTVIVWPLLKKTGQELIHKNYHPVSNLCFISKLVEWCMLKQLLDHFNKSNLPTDFTSLQTK